MLTREQWTARPLTERRIAAQTWCDGWNDANEGTDRDTYDIKWPNVIDRFALDAPDVVPAEERVDLTPYLTAVDVGQPDEFNRNKGWDDTVANWAQCKIKCARALRDAAGKP